MLNRFITMKQEEKRKPRERRPYLASECRDLADAERWRSEILREIGAKVAEIQNEGLGEHRLRDLNDEINKLLRERGHWERRIVELGSRDYSRSSNAQLQHRRRPQPLRPRARFAATSAPPGTSPACGSSLTSRPRRGSAALATRSTSASTPGTTGTIL